MSAFALHWKFPMENGFHQTSVRNDQLFVAHWFYGICDCFLHMFFFIVRSMHANGYPQKINSLPRFVDLTVTNQWSTHDGGMPIKCEPNWKIAAIFHSLDLCQLPCPTGDVRWIAQLIYYDTDCVRPNTIYSLFVRPICIRMQWQLRWCFSSGFFFLFIWCIIHDCNRAYEPVTLMRLFSGLSF